METIDFLFVDDISFGISGAHVLASLSGRAHFSSSLIDTQNIEQTDLQINVPRHGCREKVD